MISGLAWECTCGNIEYSEEPPEECFKCGALDTFMQIPADVLKNREELSIIDDVPSKNLKLKSKKKTGRKKK